eukprot:jgi/Orpsp1_1/1174994/evm.model.c7180000052246.1
MNREINMDIDLDISNSENKENFTNLDDNFNKDKIIEDSQRTLYESSLCDNKLTGSSLKTSKGTKNFKKIYMPPNHQFLSLKIKKIILFLNKLNNLWGNDIFREHQQAFSSDQKITTNGFAEAINRLIKMKFLKNKNNVHLYELIEAIAGELNFNKDAYINLSKINLTNKNMLDNYIQKQIQLNYSDTNDRNVIPTKDKNCFYIKKGNIVYDNSDDLTEWLSPYFFINCIDQMKFKFSSEYEIFTGNISIDIDGKNDHNNNDDCNNKYKIQLAVGKILKPEIDNLYNQKQIINNYPQYSLLDKQII